ncbi:MAG: hypothetical protein E7K46_10610, partial [Corynebacterium sp.]|nr:hypothetical protein [Corynebacterium sp.]
PDGLVFHADRGTQFTSEKLWEVCRNLGIAQSVGECLMVCVWVPSPHKEMDQNDYCGETRSG